MRRRILPLAWLLGVGAAALFGTFPDRYARYDEVLVYATVRCETYAF